MIEEHVLDNNLSIYINHIKDLLGDFKAQFKDLLHMKIPEWIISSIDVEVENGNLDTFLKEDFTEMTFDLETKSIYTFKGWGYDCMNEKNCGKIAQAFCDYWAHFTSFLNLYVVESFEHRKKKVVICNSKLQI